jgi:hypothetical protein
MYKLALPIILLACIGCLSPGDSKPYIPKSSADVPHNPARLALNVQLLGNPGCIPGLYPKPCSPDDNVSRIVSSSGFVPEYFTRGCSSAEKGERFVFEFQCVKDASQFGTSCQGWLLPSTEYRRITSSLYRELVDTITQAGAEVGHRRETGSTFEIDYTCPRVMGTVRGRIGPARGTMTLIEIDVDEKWSPPSN